jgi:hypothetical protein
MTYTRTCHIHSHVSYTLAVRTSPSMRGSPLAASTRSRKPSWDDVVFVVNMGLGVNSRTMCSVADLSVSVSARAVAQSVAAVGHMHTVLQALCTMLQPLVTCARGGGYCCAIVGRVSTSAGIF